MFWNKKSNKEIERRFLVPVENFNRAIWLTEPGTEIKQGYILDNPGCVIRIREERRNTIINPVVHTVTIKGIRIKGECFESEQIVPKEVGAAAMGSCKYTLAKTRHTLKYRGVKIELDVFHGEALSGLMIAEVELKDIDQEIYTPIWFGDEITNDHSYSNLELAKRCSV